MEYGLVLLWLATYLALGLLGLPVASVLCRRLADRGAGVAVPLSLAVVAVVVLWVGRVSFGWPALIAGLAVLSAASLASLRFGDVAPDWRIAGETAGVFAGAFLFLVAVRAVDPAVHPLLGEKFLDFGLLKSLLRSGTLPPEDMWFAGEPVAYYYGGHLIASLLATLTGTAAKYAYNLALAGYYAMLVTAAFGLGGALAAARGASRRTGGLWAAFLVGFASNLHTAGQMVLWALPDAIAEPIARYAASGPEAAATLLGGPDAFRYWDASRIIDGTINEFPLFAWLNGDLHAHMMGTPFLLLVATLLAAYYLTPRESVGRRRALVLGAVPVVGGLLAVVDTWAFPTVMGLTALALLFAPADPATLLPGRVADRLAATGAGTRVGAEVRRLFVAGGISIAAQLVAVAWALPFLLGPASSRDVAVLPDRSGLGGLLLVHGAFLAVFAVYLLDRAPLADRDEWLQVAIVVLGTVAVGVVANAAALGLFGPLLAGAWILLRRGADPAVDAGPAGEATGVGPSGEADDPNAATNGRGDGRPGRPSADLGFETVLLIAGAGLVLIVEFAFVEELAGPERMNTVFKTYMQVWILWGAAAGAMVATLAAERLGDRREGSPSLPRRSAVVRAGMALLVVSTSLYGAMALSAHFAGEGYYSPYATVDDPTLNATRFVEEGHPGEAEAIRWIDDLEGQPTIVTAPGGYFWRPARGDGASAPASLTGVPTVVGWHHEVGYRGYEPYQQRVDDVERIYTGKAGEQTERDPARQAELLAKYDVRYVYVGPAERATYDGISFEGLDGVGEPMEFGDVLIYPVDPENVSA